MASKIFSAGITGLETKIIEIETDVSYGLRSFSIVGLPDKSVEESKERVSSAIKSSGFSPPYRHPQRVLVNLAPADLKKEGALYDLPIALGYLLASRQVNFNPERKLFVGELGLNGKLRPIKGALSLTLFAQKNNYQEIILPRENCIEAGLAIADNKNNSQIRIIGVDNLKEAIDYLEKRKFISPFKTDLKTFLKKPEYQININWIKGQESAKRVLEIVAGGGHNLIMIGPPGTGKSLLAKSLPSILPGLSFNEMMEITQIYSIAGLLPKTKPLITTRPFRSPHHTSSETAIIGGGNPPRPGEITLAHRGILFLDEFPEFHRDVLESLRQPLEERKITILRAKYYLSFPASFTLVAAANPCPCGHYGDPNKVCTCTASQIASYRRKLSGPLIDRIDLSIKVPQVKYEKLISPEKEDICSKIKERVENARKIQKERFLKEGILTNSEMQIPQIKKYCQIDLKSQTILKKFVDKGELSVRGYHKVLKTARTIADLENSENIKYSHIAEALMYRIEEN